MEPLVIFGAGLVIYCGYLAFLDSTKAWRACRAETAAKRSAAKKRHTAASSRLRPRPETGIAVVGRPLLQKA